MLVHHPGESKSTSTRDWRMTADTAVDLAIALGAKTLVSLYVAYLDESGTHDNSQCVVVGGFVSDSDSWLALGEEWQDFITRPPYELEFLHMTDFVARKKPYDKWADGDRLNFMVGVTDIIRRHVRACVAASLPTKHYAQFKEKDPSLPSAYALAGGACWRNIGAWAEISGTAGPVTTIFEEPSRSPKDKQAKKDLLDLHSEFSLDIQLAKPYHIGGIGFTRKETSPAVQTGDFFAFETYKRMTKGVTNTKAFRKSVESVVNQMPTFATYISDQDAATAASRLK